jgi:hypothetical protein
MNDILLVDWNAALLVDSEGDDVRALLEFANVELLEMRYVDQKLDRALDPCRMVNRRFHLEEWDSSILRKLQSLESIYEKISHQASNRRTEMLEWIIIVLIAFSIAVGFIH